MGSYVLRRLGYMLILLFVVSILIFGITHALPGNVAKVILGQYATTETLHALELKLGLNDPLYVQYEHWIGPLFRGDLGESLLMNRPIAPVIVEHLARSAGLAVISLVTAAFLGICLGVFAAVWRGRLVDYQLSLFTFLGISVPEFFWGIVLIVLVSAKLGLLPSSGYAPLSDGFGAWLQHLVLPVLTLVFVLLAHISRMTRSSMIDALMSSYVLYARAKGVPRRAVIFRHALRNALIPAVTVITLNFGWLMGGIVVVETVFAIPGFGQLMIMAIRERDIPLIQMCVLIMAAIYLLTNLVADILYAYLDPRIRYVSAAA